jgi:type II secretory pathway pseudopilin PulG
VKSRRSFQRGFTLIEAILSAGLLGLLAVTATFFWVDGLGLARTVNYDSAAIADGRAAMERLAREIREVKYDTAAGAFCISTLAATQIVFNKTSGSYATGCGGATPTGSNNDIAVSVQWPNGTPDLNLAYAGTLASPATSKALTTYVSIFGIRYLDIANATTTSASAVRYVELSLTVQPTGVQATQTRTVVALRNN